MKKLFAFFCLAFFAFYLSASSPSDYLPLPLCRQSLPALLEHTHDSLPFSLSNDAPKFNRSKLPSYPAIDTIEIEASYYGYNRITDGTPYFDVYAQNADRSFMFEAYVATSTFNGNFFLNDIIADMLRIKGKERDITDFSCVLVDDGKNYSIDLYITASDRHCYHSFFSYTAPIAIDTVNLVVYNSILTRYSDGFAVSCNDESLPLNAVFTIASTSLNGSYHINNLYNLEPLSSLFYNHTFYQIWDFDATMVYSGPEFIFDAYVLISGSHCLHVSMIFQLPVPVDTIDVYLPQSDITTYLNAFTVVGESDDHLSNASLTVYTDDTNGSFSYNDFCIDTNFTYLNYNGQRIDAVDFYADMITDGPEFTCDAYILSRDAHCYHTVLSYILPSDFDTIQMPVLLADGEFDNFHFIISGNNSQQNFDVQLYLRQPPLNGTYTYSDLFTVGTQNSFIHHNDSNIAIVGLNASLTLYPNSFLFDAYILAKNRHCYHAVFERRADTTQVTFDNAEYSFDREQHIYKVYAFSGQNQLTIQFLTDSFPGVYNLDNMNSVSFKYNGETMDRKPYNDNVVPITSCLASVTVGPGCEFAVDAILQCSPFRFFHINAFFNLPPVKDTVEVVINNAEFKQSDETFSIEGNDSVMGYFARCILSGRPDHRNYTFHDLTSVNYKSSVISNSSSLYSISCLFLDFHGNLITNGSDISFDTYALASDSVCYHITFSYNPPQPNDTIQITLVSSELTTYDDHCILKGYTQNPRDYITLLLLRPAGNDTLDFYDVCSDNNSTIKFTNYKYIKDFNAIMTYDDFGYSVDAYILASDSICYHVFFCKQSDSIDIDFYDVTVQPRFMATEFIDLFGENEDYNFAFSFFNNSFDVIKVGSYDLASVNDVYMNEISTHKHIVPLDFKADVYADEGDGLFVDAFIKAQNLQTYHLRIFYSIPQAVDTVYVLADNAQLKINDTCFTVSGLDRNINISALLVVNYNYINSNFNFQNLNIESKRGYVNIEGDNFAIRNFHGNMIKCDSYFSFDTYILADNAVCYHVLFSYNPPAANDTIDVDSYNAFFINRSNSCLVTGSNRDSSVSVQLMFNRPAGSCTLSPAELSVNSSDNFIVVNQKKMGICNLTAGMSLADNGFAFDAYILASDTTCYHFFTNRTFQWRELLFDSVCVHELDDNETWAFVGCSDSCMMEIIVDCDTLSTRSLGIDNFSDAMLLINGVDHQISDFKAELVYDTEDDWKMEALLLTNEMVIYRALLRFCREPAGSEVLSGEGEVIEKFLRDGQLIIRRQGHEYTVHGQRLR
ncbi:MAG: hypothetical protein MJZ82_04810 [Paludibacteraceae bacterium]|nr:hypothetical protein [Paludibacteraceae bacterium]